MKRLFYIKQKLYYVTQIILHIFIVITIFLIFNENDFIIMFWIAILIIYLISSVLSVSFIGCPNNLVKKLIYINEDKNQGKNISIDIIEIEKKIGKYKMGIIIQYLI